MKLKDRRWMTESRETVKSHKLADGIDEIIIGRKFANGSDRIEMDP